MLLYTNFVYILDRTAGSMEPRTSDLTSRARLPAASWIRASSALQRYIHSKCSTLKLGFEFGNRPFNRLILFNLDYIWSTSSIYMKKGDSLGIQNYYLQGRVGTFRDALLPLGTRYTGWFCRLLFYVYFLHDLH